MNLCCNVIQQQLATADDMLRPHLRVADSRSVAGLAHRLARRAPVNCAPNNSPAAAKWQSTDPPTERGRR